MTEHEHDHHHAHGSRPRGLVMLQAPARGACCTDDGCTEAAPAVIGSVVPGAGTVDLKVHGLDCAEEVSLLKSALAPLVGEERLAFDVLRSRLLVDVAGSGKTIHDVLAAVTGTGMRAEPFRAEPAAGAPPRRRSPRDFATLAAAAALGSGFLVDVAGNGLAGALGSSGGAGGLAWATRGLYAIAIALGVVNVAPKALAAVRRLRPDMNLLMTIAVVGAIVIGDWLEAATVAVLFAVSLALERWSVGRARRAVDTLMRAAPTSAQVRRGGSVVTVEPENVAVDEVIVVAPGALVPLDGVVVAGESAVNQAPITGESAPVEKKPDAEVFAGTVNGDGAFDVRVTKASSDTMLARVARLIEEAQTKRGGSERFVEKFAAIYTPVILGLAVGVAVIPPLAFGAAWATWGYQAIVLLVIGCPCALVISTPVSIVAGLAAAAHAGVLIKGGEHLESPARLKAVALDKTGTVTRGKPRVVDVVPFNHHSASDLLRIAAAVEARSEHPIARAVVEHARTEGIAWPDAIAFRAERGKGAHAVVDDEEHWLGSHRFLEERGQETPDVHAWLEALEADGKTIVVLGNADHVCGFLSLADTVRDSAASTIRELHALGVAKVAMLTGDNAGTANVVAAAVHVDEVRAELLPDEKVAAVAGLVEKVGPTAMIGDGVNDAPAMARATLGIAMGAAGSDTAIETADVALMSDDLAKIPWLIRHSRRTLAVIRTNIAFALAVKGLFVVLAFSGHASLWMAIAADMGASLLVTANGLRLLRS